ncbi:MAG TPA: AAA family ATPase [Fimbriimonas sp.]|nr:AAA family ATPase [Fimbriimonas sp.]
MTVPVTAYPHAANSLEDYLEPMQLHSLLVDGFQCFKGAWSGLEEFQQICIVIGRNNSGKSRLVDLVESLCQVERMRSLPYKLRLRGAFEETDLKSGFSDHVSAGVLQGQHWHDHGAKLVGLEAEWVFNGNQVVGRPIFHPETQLRSPFGVLSTNARTDVLVRVLTDIGNPFFGKSFYRLSADRDILPEVATLETRLESNGEGATNIIRRHLTSTQKDYNIDLIRERLLGTLNSIFLDDGQFTEIQVKQHDTLGVDGKWEIFLGERDKGLVPLSRSGSGLKTIILVLLVLLVIPKPSSMNLRDTIFAFEELENNLHPALQRRLFNYIENFARKTGASFYLTTHSSACLDYFAASNVAQIIRILHDGANSRTALVRSHFDKTDIISELGVRPSDLLQANGVVWVEGPSDRIYVNHWIKLISGGELVEGRHYQCATYGGALIANVEFKAPEEQDEAMINLLRLNNNVVVICDRDGVTNSSGEVVLKKRVKRILGELKNVPAAYTWVTKPREIENYLPARVLRVYFKRPSMPHPEAAERMFSSKGQKGLSFFEQHAGVSFVDKVHLASGVADIMTVEDLKERFDLFARLSEITDLIRQWNK